MKVWLIRLTLLFVGFMIATFTSELGLGKLAPDSRTLSRKFHELDKILDPRLFPMRRENGVSGR